MKKSRTLPLARPAILTLAEIKAAITAFDRGDANLFDTLDAIAHAIEVARPTMQLAAQGPHSKRKAA